MNKKNPELRNHTVEYYESNQKNPKFKFDAIIQTASSISSRRLKQNH